MGTDATVTAEAERLDAWMRDHGVAVRGYLWGIVRRNDQVDDLTQEVFLRAWRHRDRYREEGHARAFLLRIADRLACDQLRRGLAESSRLERVRESLDPHAGPIDPARQAVQAEAARRLAEALDLLSPIQRRVLLLRFYGALAFQEIADALEIPVGTALSHCHRGLQALRKQFVE